jgi:hypothetical protein
MPVDDIERQWVLQLANCMRGMPTPPLLLIARTPPPLSHTHPHSCTHTHTHTLIHTHLHCIERVLQAANILLRNVEAHTMTWQANRRGGGGV